MYVDMFIMETEASTGANSSLSSSKKNESINQETCTCPNNECAKNFDHPIELTVLSSNPVETYLACPYCMSRIDERQEVEEEPRVTKSSSATSRIAALLKKEQEKEGEKETDEDSCSHGYGYLKKRPKDAPIPDECLVCKKMIQCLA